MLPNASHAPGADAGLAPVDGLADPIDELFHLIDGVADPVDDLFRPVDGVAAPVDDLFHPIDGLADPVDDLREPIDWLADPVDEVSIVILSTAKDLLCVRPRADSRSFGFASG